ncbi:glycosyltransferase [Nitratidesulfovibrio liaohensis]|uniref:Glycosyltransferase n=1 Tax=Nitratidesulfovibrio liaohensis TaxID=2604158 RepID=A0ABY9R4U1_9BACT|nr:glycosyltransferase [Nitratidesulfovibrio liaohensis]WMW66771.1 glycosyltransferase [Nitratidesulfovibrio liaohensis]
MRLVIAKKLRFPQAAANHIQAVNMASAFASCGVETEIYPSLRGGDARALAAHLADDYAVDLPPALRVRAIPFHGPTLYDAVFHWRLLRAVRTPNTVLLAREAKPAALLLQLRRLTGRRAPVFFEMHQQRHEELTRKILAEAAGVVFIDEALQNWARERFGYTGPGVVVPSGFNPRIFAPADGGRASGGVDPVVNTGPITLCHFGSLTPEKGVAQLFDMLACLPERYRLLLVGGVSWPDMEDFRRRLHAVPDWEHRVLLAGRVAPTQVAAALREADVAVIPAPPGGEYFSQIKIYEALGLGLPLAVSPRTRLADGMREGVHHVAASGPDGNHLAEAVLALTTGADAPARLAAMRAANAALAAGFTWQARARHILDFMRATTTRT